jgi:hypothetical protein
MDGRERGLRRLVAVASVGAGLAGLWQAGLALREAHIYQVEMREAAPLWREFSIRYRSEETRNDNLSVQLEHYLDDLLADWKRRESGVRLSRSDRFEIYRLNHSTIEDERRYRDRGEIPAFHLGKVARQYRSLVVGVRADVEAATAPATDAEIWTALHWYLASAGREKPPWQFTWWPEQPAWWRWPLLLVGLLGVVLSAALGAVPWGVYRFVRWIVRGFLPTPEDALPEPRPPLVDRVEPAGPSPALHEVARATDQLKADAAKVPSPLIAGTLLSGEAETPSVATEATTGLIRADSGRIVEPIDQPKGELAESEHSVPIWFGPSAAFVSLLVGAVLMTNIQSTGAAVGSGLGLSLWAGLGIASAFRGLKVRMRTYLFPAFMAIWTLMSLTVLVVGEARYLVSVSLITFLVGVAILVTSKLTGRR